MKATLMINTMKLHLSTACQERCGKEWTARLASESALVTSMFEPRSGSCSAMTLLMSSAASIACNGVMAKQLLTAAGYQVTLVISGKQPSMKNLWGVDRGNEWIAYL